VQQFRLAAIDLDGTLLRSDSSISDRSRAAIAAARAAGVTVTIVTERGPVSVREIARDAGIGGAAVCNNGALVLDLESGVVRRQRLLDTEIALELVHGMRRKIPGIRFAVEYKTFAHEPGFSAWGWEPPAGTRVADAVELLADPATKLILRHPDHALEAIAAVAHALVGEGAEIVASGSHAIEVTAAGVNKASGLAELADELGIESADVVAFGDYPNDAAMLVWAGLGVAVANAHAEVLAVADEVTASNDDDGVALVLERLLA